MRWFLACVEDLPTHPLLRAELSRSPAYLRMHRDVLLPQIIHLLNLINRRFLWADSSEVTPLFLQTPDIRKSGRKKPPPRLTTIYKSPIPKRLTR